MSHVDFDHAPLVLLQQTIPHALRLGHFLNFIKVPHCEKEVHQQLWVLDHKINCPILQFEAYTFPSVESIKVVGHLLGQSEKLLKAIGSEGKSIGSINYLLDARDLKLALGEDSSRDLLLAIVPEDGRPIIAQGDDTVFAYLFRVMVLNGINAMSK